MNVRGFAVKVSDDNFSPQIDDEKQLIASITAQSLFM